MTYSVRALGECFGLEAQGEVQCLLQVELGLQQAKLGVSAVESVGGAGGDEEKEKAGILQVKDDGHTELGLDRRLPTLGNRLL